jgi:NADH dehydrogenase
MLHEVAASDLDLTNIVAPIRKMLRRVKFISGETASVDTENRTVTVLHGTDRHKHELPYDHLVLSPGSVTNFFGLPGLESRALTMKTLEDAITVRNRLIAHLEESDTECVAHLREELLTFVVAGGGFSGVETVAGIFDLLHDSVRHYHNLTRNMIRVVLVHPGKHILPELGEELGVYAENLLRKRGIDIRTGVRVASVGENEVALSDGSKLCARFLIWTAGTAPNPMLAQLPFPKKSGRLLTDANLAVVGTKNVWALGDCAYIPDGDGCFPPTAQHALREARTVARNIAATLKGEPPQPFRFKTLGQLAAIGQRTGVAQMLGFKFSGFIAWWLWRSIYLLKLPSFEKKVRVAFDWTLDLFFSKDIVQYKSFYMNMAMPEVGMQSDGAAPPTSNLKAHDEPVEGRPESTMVAMA